MKKYLCTFLFLLQLSLSYGQHYNETYGTPLIVLTETDPWLMVIGSDVPSFALYENGQVIYKKMVAGNPNYFETKLTKEKVQEVIESLGITDSLMLLPTYTEASSRTDQPTNEIIFNFNTVTQISVYGNLRDHQNEARQKAPQLFLTVYDNIINFNDKDAEKWLPDTIEIMATKYSYSPLPSLKWGKTWSDIKTPSTIQRSDYLYSIYLDKKYFQDFIKLIKSLKEKQAVEINGEKYSLSYRLLFPNVR
jgi:hypothetical protein